MVSRTFKIALKLSDRPAYRIAQEAHVDPNVLSKIVNNIIRVETGDERVIRIGQVLGLKSHECFETPREN